MRFSHPSMFAFRIAALAAVVATGSALGCDVEGEPSIDELELLEAVDIDPSAEEQRIDELTVAPEEGEEYVGLDSRIDQLAAEIDPLAFSFLPWHSEETPGASQCGSNQVVTGFDCNGSYCDDVRLECHNYGTSVSSGGTWSAWFQSGSKVSHVCPSGQKITGIDCKGSYCDDITIRCSSAPGLDTARCAWSGWYSEENPSPFFADVGDAIQGIWCSGTHCDNKSFLVCET